jgi:hypothetical protein
MTTAIQDPAHEAEHLRHECSRLHSQVVHLQMEEERLKAEVLRLEAENDGLRAENCRLNCQRSSVLAILAHAGAPLGRG